MAIASFFIAMSYHLSVRASARRGAFRTLTDRRPQALNYKRNRWQSVSFEKVPLVRQRFPRAQSTSGGG
jgi:hypothetical protein